MPDYSEPSKAYEIREQRHPGLLGFWGGVTWLGIITAPRPARVFRVGGKLRAFGFRVGGLGFRGLGFRGFRV